MMTYELDASLDGDKVAIFDKECDATAVSLSPDKTLRFYTSGSRWPVYFYPKEFVSFKEFGDMIRDSGMVNGPTSGFACELPSVIILDTGEVGYKVSDIRGVVFM